MRDNDDWEAMYRRAKLWTLIAVCLIIMLSLTACGGSDDPIETASKECLPDGYTDSSGVCHIGAR